VSARQAGRPQVTLTGYLVCVDSAALPGYQVVRLSSAEVANRSSREASCPAGKVVVGGGAEAGGTDAALRVSVAPPSKGAGSTWTASGQSLSQNTVRLMVDAICADPVPGYEVVELPAAQTPNNTLRSVACPSGKAP
jgi:hypothetical protein